MSEPVILVRCRGCRAPLPRRVLVRNMGVCARCLARATGLRVVGDGVLRMSRAEMESVFDGTFPGPAVGST